MLFTLAKFIKIMPATATSNTHHCYCLGHPEQHGTDGIVSFFVASHKVAKARTYSVAVADVFTKITSPM
jgi:hypothetical protein